MNVPAASQPPPSGDEDGRVPLFGTWRRAYVIVLAVLAANILLLYGCTRWLA